MSSDDELDIGILLYVCVMAVNCVALVMDALLWRNGHRTITQFARDHALVAWAILLWNYLGFIGLMWHLLWSE